MKTMKEGIHMSQNDWMDIGKSISHSIKNAVDTLDFTELNNSIEKTVSSTTKMINKKIREYTNADSRSQINRKYNIKKISKLEKKIKNNMTLYRIFSMIGGIGTGVFALFSILILLIEGWAAGKAAIGATALIAVPFFIFLILGIAGHSTEKKKDQYMRRFHVYISQLTSSDMIPIPVLAESVYSTNEATIADLHDMIADGLFLQGHVNQKKNTFYSTNEAYEASKLPDIPHPENSRPHAQDETLPPEALEFIQEGEKALLRIRHYNDVIKDPVISQKLTDLENNIRHILTFIQDNPQEVDEAKNLTKYYLPSIDKLLETYVELSSYPTPGENIRKSKQEIENTLDTLNYALSKMYDDLFEMTSMEVASDISVLETLLDREGLTKEKIHVK